jgi:hypothetical protein
MNDFYFLLEAGVVGQCSVDGANQYRCSQKYCCMCWTSTFLISPLAQALVGLDKLSSAMAVNLSRVRIAS